MSNTELPKGFPREVVVSPGYGAGFCTWMGVKNAYDLVEHPETVRAVNDGWPFDMWLARMIELGLVDGDDYIYSGGWQDCVVVTVYGPYRIEEYDGNEYIVEMNKTDWRT